MRQEQWLAGFHANLVAAQARQVFTTKKTMRLPRQLTEYLANPHRGELAELIEQDLAWARAPNNHLIVYDNENYPPLLKQIKDAPCVLFVRGEPSTLQFASIAMVGPRKPSNEGLYNTRMFAAGLVNCGFCIVSGLAEGVDGCAHTSALAQNGRTIAVIGTGIDLVYPHMHRSLTEEIINSGRGTLVSIFRRGSPPLPKHFPLRNRVISGMSMATLVVEAGLRSGAMITARLAGEQGRDVFAVPGSIHAPLAKGCHKLIRDGAQLAESCDDLVAQLRPMYDALQRDTQQDEADDKSGTALAAPPKKRPTKQPPANKRIDAMPRATSAPEPTRVARSSLSAASYKVLAMLDYRPTHPDELADRLAVDELNRGLAELELLGLVSQENGLYRRTPTQLSDNKNESAPVHEGRDPS